MTELTTVETPASTTGPLLQLFINQVRAHGTDLALRHGETSLTYDELDSWSDALAGKLADAGVGPGDLVGLSVGHSTAVVAALLALLKVRAGFVALEPAVPLRRRRQILGDSKPVALLLGREHDRYPDTSLPRVWVGRPVAGAPVALAESDGAALFQVVYTSGTTGKPKGVSIGQDAVLNRLRWMWRDFPFPESSVMLAHKSYGLVAAPWELLGGLLRGVPTVLADREDLLDTEVLVPLLAKQRISHLFLTPHLLELLLDSRDRHPDVAWSPRLVTSGADVLSPDLARRFRAAFRGATFLNLYGLTECSSNVAAYDLAGLPDDATRVPVGIPVAGARIHVLDRTGRAAPVGVTGEIWVAGPVLALGYRNPDSAAEDRFVTGRDGERRFRTGDLGHWHGDGTLEVTGRADNQVKVRGYRVELEEIEATLARAPHVLDIAVAALPGEAGPELTCAAVGDGELDLAAIRAYARDLLPEYMRPVSFVRLPAVPITANGKLDRARLAEVLAGQAAESTEPAAPVEFANDLQREVAGLWERVLGVAVRDLTENFFDAGGHSLLAVRLVALLREQFDSGISLRAFYDDPTIEGLVSHVPAGQAQ